MLGESRYTSAVSSVTSVAGDNLVSDANKIPIYTASDLNPEVKTPWKFIGRIPARNPIRPYKSWRGHGKLFEVYATDEKCDPVRATVFNEGVESFYDLLVPGSICSFSNGRIKTANTAFARTVAVELSFGGDADIRPE